MAGAQEIPELPTEARLLVEDLEVLDNEFVRFWQQMWSRQRY
jgi:hypothetical protein